MSHCAAAKAGLPTWNDSAEEEQCLARRGSVAFVAIKELDK